MNRQSPKRLAAIADGSFKPKPRKPLSRAKAGTPQAGRMVRRAFGKTPKSSKAQAKKRAWDWFSKFIRLRDADEFGRVKCITCPAVKRWEDMDAGHYITRAKESTLFDEHNVSGQCSGCNRWQGGKFLEHAQALDRKFGAGTRDRLEAKAGQECRRTLSDYQFIEATYRSRVERIKEVEPRKYHRAV